MGPIKLSTVIKLLECGDEEFMVATKNISRLNREIERLRHHINPYADFPYLDEPEVIRRRIHIFENTLPKIELVEAVERNARKRIAESFEKRSVHTC